MDTDAESEAETDTNTKPAFTVERDGRTLVTLHEGTDTTARSAATAQLSETLEELTTSTSITDWTVGDAEVSEPPAAPFDPYTIAVAFSVSVTVEADDAATAESIGANAIDETLEAAGLDGVSYTADPVVSVS
ncbi:hypothetical protein OB955_07885 [Halobacteria archaeon AArc-m2/3/4]|uniref:Uncharacterized protein n=1 Tax=Natronoglomus mannanivorans TaxID=2979990 RepID=A0ABT2QCK7_9EURY|nr:hypothetical protein [Halobacteria archaeon AArc-m2/3/4]